MKIAVAMSGGVDSSAAAYILLKAGHQVTGITADIGASLPSKDTAHFQRAVNDAVSAAALLGIEHHVITFGNDFIDKVITPFCRMYLAGKTPNPCILCNPSVKFKQILQKARGLSCDMIATGHYACMGRSSDRRYFVSRSDDITRDQSYFLSFLHQEELSRLLLPLGTSSKEEIRGLVREIGMDNADKPDSQEICFIPDDDYRTFIERTTGVKPGPGEIVDTEGNVIGTHKGIHHYTIGQRKGLGIAAPYPLYVTAIDASKNRIIAGSNDMLERRGLVAKQVHLMKSTGLHDREVQVKIRSTHSPVPATVTIEDSTMRVIFHEKIRGVTPGQAVVCYDEETSILASAIIEEAL